MVNAEHVGGDAKVPRRLPERTAFSSSAASRMPLLNNFCETFTSVRGPGPGPRAVPDSPPPDRRAAPTPARGCQPQTPGLRLDLRTERGANGKTAEPPEINLVAVGIIVRRLLQVVKQGDAQDFFVGQTAGLQKPGAFDARECACRHPGSQVPATSIGCRVEDRRRRLSSSLEG